MPRRLPLTVAQWHAGRRHLHCLHRLPSAAAADDPAPVDDEPIVIPAGAKEVKTIYNFIGHTQQNALNSHMFLLWSGSKPYLIVFERPCRNLSKDATSTDERDVHVHSIVRVGMMDCQIDHIYRITSEDADSLRRNLAK
jgi:hypothetical protein